MADGDEDCQHRRPRECPARNRDLRRLDAERPARTMRQDGGSSRRDDKKKEATQRRPASGRDAQLPAPTALHCTRAPAPTGGWGAAGQLDPESGASGDRRKGAPMRRAACPQVRPSAAAGSLKFASAREVLLGSDGRPRRT